MVNLYNMYNTVRIPASFLKLFVDTLSDDRKNAKKNELVDPASITSVIVDKAELYGRDGVIFILT